ncbi:MAG TPA: catalase [Acetobacteraceae bacterium]|nr:catalase [Acetobacteraceae bacterium]
MFIFRDPLRFPSLNHAIKRDPRAGMRSTDNNWDVWTLLPEALDQVTIVMSDRQRAASLPPFRHPHGESHLGDIEPNEHIPYALVGSFCVAHWEASRHVRNGYTVLQTGTKYISVFVTPAKRGQFSRCQSRPGRVGERRVLECQARNVTVQFRGPLQSQI